MKSCALGVAVAAVAALVAAPAAEAALTQCEVYRLAQEAGIPEAQIPAMVCTAFYESSWNPTASNKNKNGSTDRGLWQVNNMYWCADPAFPGKGNGCGVACSTMLQALPNAQCAARILKQQGLKAWYGYTNHKATCDAYKISANCSAPKPSPVPSPLPSAPPTTDTTTGGGPTSGGTSGSNPTSTTGTSGTGTGSTKTTTGTLTTGTTGSTTGGGATTKTTGATTTGGGATTTGGGGGTTKTTTA